MSQELHSSINQSQPKMLTLNKQVRISVDTNLDRPQARRVSFYTEKNNIFYMELAMDKTEFIQLHDFEQPVEMDPDSLIDNIASGLPIPSMSGNGNGNGNSDKGNDNQDDLLASLGL